MGVVTIATKQQSQETGWFLTFDKQGNLSSQEKIMKNDGTVVTIRDLFAGIPVRLGEFKKTHRTQYTKCVGLL